MKYLLRTSSTLVLALTLAGCATAPPKALKPQDVPAAFTAPIPKNAPIWPKPNWWKGFGNQEMDDLIAEAQKSNLSLATAVAQVQQARAQTMISGSTLFPSLGLSGNAQRTGKNQGGPNVNHFGLSLDASYYVDFWGKARDNLRAAEESLLAAKYAEQVVGLTVTSNVADTYLDVLALRQRVKIARQNIDAASRILAITQAKVTNGVSSRLDLAQEQAQVAGQEAQVPGLEESAKDAGYALAVLLGRPPEGFEVKGEELDKINAPKVAPGLPSELLRRRPDVAKAEAQLAAAHANVDAARAAFFPQVNLSASGGYASAALSSLVNPASLGFSIGASLLQNIFSGGQLVGQHRLTKAEELQLVYNYRSTVLNALKDVETALGQVASLADQQKYKTQQVNAASEAFRISEIQYREGVTDLLNVLQAQQTLFSAEDQLVQIKLARIQADIGLYVALGGGWTENPDDATQPIPTSASASATTSAAPSKN